MNDLEHATESISIATDWLKKSLVKTSYTERVKNQKLDKLAANKKLRFFLINLFDQAFRAIRAKRSMRQFHYITKQFPTLELLNFKERIGYFLIKVLGWLLPGAGIKAVKAILWGVTGKVLIKSNVESLNKKLEKFKPTSTVQTVNYIGESVYGLKEAQKNLKQYLYLLKQPNVKSITIKISNLYPYLEHVNFEQAEKDITYILESIYYDVKKILIPYPNGGLASKLVMIDMETYDQLFLIKNCFKRALSNPDFNSVYTGIALQSYIPDSFEIQEEITQWAKRRAEEYHTHPIRIRLVKGANLEYERIFAELNGWNCPTYNNKLEVDAQFKKMLHYAIADNNLSHVHLGVATHNLFDLAYAYHLMQAHSIKHYMTFEMLEGIASPIQEILIKNKQDVHSYLPIVDNGSFIHALAYLTRRLDEQLGEGHFLKHYLTLNKNGEEWAQLQAQFLQSVEHVDKLSHDAKENQNRALKSRFDVNVFKEFSNVPSTNWTIEKNQEWANKITQDFNKVHDQIIKKYHLELPPEIKGNGRSIKHFFDCSSIVPKKLYTCECVSDNEMMQMADFIGNQRQWAQFSLKDRSLIMKKAAVAIQHKRGQLITMLCALIGKSFDEADKEVSEAIDFLNFYTYSFNNVVENTHLSCKAKGTGLVISPWNFPLAIPCGGIAASLITGNNVLFKPAPEVLPIAYELAQIFWEAGVPKTAFGFIPCEDSPSLDALIRHPNISYLIFTGSTQTAKHISLINPQLPIYGETGGKNTIIVTSMADRDLAIKHIMDSAFSFAGQKCSAASLLILESEVYKDQAFKEKLCDAIRSIRVGSSWDLSNRYSMRVQRPNELLKHVLTPKGNKENYVIFSRKSHENRSFLKPTLIWDVTQDSLLYQHELFAPVLGVMHAKNIKEAIKLANETNYGLTAGLESLDKREQDYWVKNIHAGNLYINKAITGAIVGRQPFGGYGLSSFGPAIKAGGEHYVTQFVNFDSDKLFIEKDLPSDHPHVNLISKLESDLAVDKANYESLWHQLVKAAYSYSYYYCHKFSQEHITQKLLGEKNSVRYLPVGNVLIYLQESHSSVDHFQMIIAALMCKNKVYIKCESNKIFQDFESLNYPVLKSILERCVLINTSSESGHDYLTNIDMVRVIDQSLLNENFIARLAKNKIYIQAGMPVCDGQIELVSYVKEQSISKTVHRFGNKIED